LVTAAKFLVEVTKNSFVVPNFVAVTKPLLSVQTILREIKKINSLKILHGKIKVRKLAKKCVWGIWVC